MKNPAPLVSVVLPVYNGAAFVEQAIRSILEQTFDDWELVVVDDGSLDNSRQICEDVARHQPRLRVYANEQNLGLARTMNRLVALSSGKYIAVQEQDDFSEPCRLALEAGVLNTQPEVALVSGVAAWIDDEGRVFNHFPGILHRGGQYPQDAAEMVRFLYTEQCKVANAACMFRRTLAEEIPGPFDPEARMSIDWQFFLRVAHRHQILGIPKTLVRMRRGASHDSLTRKKELQFQEARRCIRLVFKLYAKDKGSPINYWLYRKAMATELMIEGRSYSRIKGLFRLLQAAIYQPTKANVWASLGELSGPRVSSRPLAFALERLMTRPVPILFTIPNFMTAGSGMVLFNIASRLNREKFAPTVCVLRKGGTLEEEFERLGMSIMEAPFTVPAKPYLSLFPRAFKAARVFRPFQNVAWHSFHYADDYSEPLIARLAGAKAWIYTKKAMGWGSRAWKIRTHLATRVVADNKDMPQLMFDRAFIRHKVRVIHHGIPSGQFAPGGGATLNIRQGIGCREDEVLIACVAHLVPVKGHPTLLQALAQVPRARLVIAGKPLEADYVDSLHQMVDKLHLADRVHFLGAVKDVPALLSELDIAVLPTWAKGRMEGCPVALLEAMSCGCACVATDIPGSRDLIEHERSGLIVPPEDSAALALALQRLATSPELRQQLGRAARQRVLDHFTIEKEVAAHEALYAEVLGLN